MRCNWEYYRKNPLNYERRKIVNAAFRIAKQRYAKAIAPLPLRKLLEMLEIWVGDGQDPEFLLELVIESLKYDPCDPYQHYFTMWSYDDEASVDDLDGIGTEPFPEEDLGDN